MPNVNAIYLLVQDQAWTLTPTGTSIWGDTRYRAHNLEGQTVELTYGHLDDLPVWTTARDPDALFLTAPDAIIATLRAAAVTQQRQRGEETP